MGRDVESINQRERIKERKEKNSENSISSQNYPLERRRNEDILDIQKGRDYAARRLVKVSLELRQKKEVSCSRCMRTPQ